MWSRTGAISANADSPADYPKNGRVAAVREREVPEMAAEGEIPCRGVTGKLLFQQVEIDVRLTGGAAAHAGTPPT